MKREEKINYVAIAKNLYSRYDAANYDDAQEAVQKGVQTLLRKGRPLIGSHVYMEARTELREMLRRSERKNCSLDEQLEVEYEDRKVTVSIGYEVDFLAIIRLRDAVARAA